MVNDTDVQLSWSAPPSGPRPSGYVVLRNGSAIRNNLNRTTFADRGLDPRTYTYTVRAIGSDGSLSPASNSATVTVGPLEITSFTVTRNTAERVSVSFSANRCVTYRISAVSGRDDDPAPVTNQGGPCTDAESVILSPLDPRTGYQGQPDGERRRRAGHSDFRLAPAPTRSGLSGRRRAPTSRGPRRNCEPHPPKRWAIAAGERLSWELSPSVARPLSASSAAVHVTIP